LLLPSHKGDLASGAGERAVVVAVVAVRVVQVAVDEVVDVVAVGDRFVAAAGAVHVAGLVAAAARGAGVQPSGFLVGVTSRLVLVDVVTVRVMQVAVVQVVDVVAVPDRGVAAVGAVLCGRAGRAWCSSWLALRRARRRRFSEDGQ
jgi:hypothetical protein